MNYVVDFSMWFVVCFVVPQRGVQMAADVVHDAHAHCPPLQPSFEAALGFLLAHKLETAAICATQWASLLSEVLQGEGAAAVRRRSGTAERDIAAMAKSDLLAIRHRDPACPSLAHAFLFYKGFAGIEAHRCAHELWHRGRRAVAALIQSRVSECFGMDVHPAASLGPGLMVDHATGVVIGETAVVGRDVTMLHAVTLGGTGKQRGRRHPRVGDNVMLGAGSSLIGCINIGAGAKVGAGTTVVADVPMGATIVGVVGVQKRKRTKQADADSTNAAMLDHIADDSLLFDMAAGESGLRERLSELVLLRRRTAPEPVEQPSAETEIRAQVQSESRPQRRPTAQPADNGGGAATAERPGRRLAARPASRAARLRSRL